MQIASAAEALDWLEQRYMNGKDDRLTTWSRLCSSMERSRRETLRVQECTADMRRSDYALALSRLEHLLEEVRSQQKSLNELLDNEFRTTSIDAAVSTLREGRNALSRESLNLEILSKE